MTSTDLNVRARDKNDAPLAKVETVRDLLKNRNAAARIGDVAAHTLRPERMLKVVSTSLRTNPKLGECTPLSLLGSMMTCASLGLEANTPLGHAYLVPFYNHKAKRTEAQLIIGYKGLIDLARRSRLINNIHADVVYSDCPVFDFEYGSNQALRHKPGPRQGQPLYAYAHASLKDGGEAFTVMPWVAVMERRNSSEGWKTAVKFNNTENHPWHKHERKMAAKTAIRELASYLPLSIEMATATAIDEERANYSDIALGHVPGEAEIDVQPIYDDEGGETIDVQADPAPPATETKPAPVEAKPARRNTRARRADPAPTAAAPEPAPQPKPEPAAAPKPAPQPEPEPAPPAASPPAPEPAAAAPSSDMFDGIGDPATWAAGVVQEVEAQLDGVMGSANWENSLNRIWDTMLLDIERLKEVDIDAYDDIVRLFDEFRADMSEAE